MGGERRGDRRGGAEEGDRERDGQQIGFNTKKRKGICGKRIKKGKKGRVGRLGRRSVKCGKISFSNWIRKLRNGEKEKEGVEE